VQGRNHAVCGIVGVWVCVSRNEGCMQYGVFVPFFLLSKRIEISFVADFQIILYELIIVFFTPGGQTHAFFTGNGTGSKEYSVTNDLRNAIIQRR